MAHILVTTIAYDAERGGGSARLAYDLAVGLARRGHQITVVGEDLYDRGLKDESDEGVTVLRYRLPPASSFPVRRSDRHIEAVTELLKEHLPSPPDVVHGHSLFQYVAALRLYGRRSRCCYTIHSPFVDELPIVWKGQGGAGWLKVLLGLPTIRRLETECLSGSHTLTAESQYTCDLVRQHYGATLANRIQVVSGWVDTHRFIPLPLEQAQLAREQLKWPNDRPVLFVLRRLEARMGLDRLLHALAIVKQRGGRVHTIIGGSGSQRTRLEALRNALDLQDDAVFMGFVPGNILPLAYAACDVSVIPTAQLEGFGLIALESLACGKTTLVTPVGALPEVMQNFEPKWIARGHAPEDIANLLCAYIADSLPVHTAAELRETILERYGFPRALDAYERILLGKQVDDTLRTSP